jgi:hypothetical protein
MGDTYEVVRSTTIDAPSAVIHGFLVDFHEWTKWSPWEDVDPALERTYSGAERGVGAAYAWSGNRKAGKGSMELTGDEPLTVTVAVEFQKPFKSSSTSVFELVPQGDVTEVTWRMTGPKTFGTKVMGIFTSMDKLIGPDFEKGLARLKAAAEG